MAYSADPTLSGVASELSGVGLWAPLAAWEHEGSSAAAAAGELESIGFEALWLGNGAGLLAQAQRLLEATARITVATGAAPSGHALPGCARRRSRAPQCPPRAPPGALDRRRVGAGGRPPRPSRLRADGPCLDARPPDRPARPCAAPHAGGPRPEDARAGIATRLRRASIHRPRRAHTARPEESSDRTRGSSRRSRSRSSATPIAPGRSPGARWPSISRRATTPPTWPAWASRARELRAGGSDRVVDALVAWGGPEAIRRRVDEHLGAGADQVALQLLTDDPDGRLPRDGYERLAAAALRIAPPLAGGGAASG